jgi:hypothetical protein
MRFDLEDLWCERERSATPRRALRARARRGRPRGRSRGGMRTCGGASGQGLVRLPSPEFPGTRCSRGSCVDTNEDQLELGSTKSKNKQAKQTSRNQTQSNGIESRSTLFQHCSWNKRSRRPLALRAAAGRYNSKSYTSHYRTTLIYFHIPDSRAPEARTLKVCPGHMQ